MVRICVASSGVGLVVPSVSVVIPAYRAEGTIAREIDSVLAQTSPARGPFTQRGQRDE
jgi:hypothetical protein